MSKGKFIYIVDDDDWVRKSLERLLKINDYRVVSCRSGKEFLDLLDDTHYGCILLDIDMPYVSGLEVQNELISLDCKMPIIFMTGHGDVPTSVRAMKNGAIEFLEKPYPIDVMLERVEHAMLLEDDRRVKDEQKQTAMARLGTLTKRENQVMRVLVSGHANHSNKAIAGKLHLSPRTVEDHRAKIKSKMAASSITHLVEMAKLCGIYQD